MRTQIVLFGDSITEQSFRSVRGYGGYNTRCALFLLHHLFPLGSANPPAAVTIFFGANDAALSGRTSKRQHVPVEEYKENLRKIVHHLKQCSSVMLVALVTPPPIDKRGRMEYAQSLYGDKAMKEPERTNEVAGVYAKNCVDLAKELGLPVVDLDGLHLTPEGNSIVYQEVQRVFNEAGISAQELPYDFPHHSEIDGKNPGKAFWITLLIASEFHL
ncbi:SGNH hydrolase-type esterase domain, partial [Dillenia turbinata]